MLGNICVVMLYRLINIMVFKNFEYVLLYVRRENIFFVLFVCMVLLIKDCRVDVIIFVIVFIVMERKII